MIRLEPDKKLNYLYFMDIPTRWMDNDVYLHVNNVVYYSFFDTAVNHYLIENKVLDIKESSIIGLVVETQCNYFSPIEFPEIIKAGIRVSKLGKSSVRYEIGLFVKNNALASAQGHFVHVYVNRGSRKAMPIPSKMRSALQKILVTE